ncbi:phage portal protein [Cucumibacter marinus]|uniref:phage portal protein n=1 Tax=Cucumibacter marinus TaxID=1121252 RepID=UPI0004072D7C|nr:phage portal protein [Cucumibacter marinus]
MPNWLARLTGGGAPERVSTPIPPEGKSAVLNALIGAGAQGGSVPRSYAGLARAGMMRNPVVFRCIRLIAEGLGAMPLVVEEGGQRFTEHRVLGLIERPNPRQTRQEFLETIGTNLMAAGDAYCEAVSTGGDLAGLYLLRPDRVSVTLDADGWPRAYRYTAGGRTRQIPAGGAGGGEPLLHLSLGHPLDDHHGLAPLAAAAAALEVHNAAQDWNRSLLANAARPSGALVYTAGSGNLTGDQFERLKTELEAGYQGALNAGRPLVLEGGLDWKALGLSPRDMDFIEAKNGAARDIALAFGVPPMVLGIPGDNTYANYAEANRALWRQTIIPLARRITGDLSRWLGGHLGGDWRLAPDTDRIEALSAERAQLWEQIGKADFLSDAEKRRMLGLGEGNSGQ